jgi:hypothetical protein
MQGFKAGEVDKIESVQGYDRVRLFARSLAEAESYSNADYGVPVAFYVSKITDNSSIKFRFSYRLDFDAK